MFAVHSFDVLSASSYQQKTINQKLVRTTLQTKVIEVIEEVGVDQMGAINVSIGLCLWRWLVHIRSAHFP